MDTQLLISDPPVAYTARRAGFLALLAASLLVTACSHDRDQPRPAAPTANAYPAEVATKWAGMELQLIRKGVNFPGPIASRALGYASVALYEAVVPGLADHQSLTGQLSELRTLSTPTGDPAQMNWAVSANAAEALVLKNLFGNASAAQVASIDSLEQAPNAPYSAQPGFVSSQAFGRAIAQAVFEWSKTDGGHEAYLRVQPKDYTPPVGPGLWVQTRPGDAGRAQLPTWGSNRSLVPVNGTLPLPAPGYVFSLDPASPYMGQVREVFATGNTLTPDQRTIALYWSDGAQTILPAGHSLNIATILIQDHKMQLGAAAEAYARLGLAVADAYRYCWKTKYAFNWERPVTCIQRAMDPAWKPLLANPDFPDYLSGHATQSGAVAQALSDLFGPATSFTDNSHQARGAGFEPRTFPTIMAFAEESAVSRIYGGIHYRSAVEVGLTQGRLVGRNVSLLTFRKP